MSSEPTSKPNTRKRHATAWTRKSKLRKIDTEKSVEKEEKLQSPVKSPEEKTSQESSSSQSSNSIEYGKCCFCKKKCNPLSQSCGKCAREMTMASFGRKKIISKKLTL